MSPAYGRSEQGQPAYEEKPTYSSDTVSTVAILTEEGIKAQYTYPESLNAALFVLYLDTYLLSLLNNGETLIMDNHPVHHAKIVQEYLVKNNIKFLFLPSYSPELNPIEEAFSKIKQYIKKQKPRVLNKLLRVIDDAFKIITGDDAKGYFKHASEF